MTEADIGRAAQLYRDHVPDSFFKSFGRGFIELLLAGASRSGNGRCYVCVEDDRVAGFIVAALDKKGLFKEMAGQHGLALCGCCFRAVIRNPAAAASIFQTAAYGLRGAGPSRARAEMLFTAVDPAQRRRGICAALVRAVLDDLRKGGAAKVCVSVLKDNRGVNALLGKLGFKLLGPFRLYRKEMLSYELTL